MIPISLTIQGLYSYQERQTIDFTQLTAANLFGIFGPVGSGKSTILEAITFAIYGRTDRLNLSGDNRYYNMMNLRSNEMLIDFIFEAGKEQTTYRTTVKSSRNSRNFDDVRTPERTAYRKREGEGTWKPIEVESLEEAIGLSYDNFKRTIIIPQGQFQEFLQLGNRDRTKMMKELFNLEKFEFYYKVVSLEKKNDEKRQHIQGQLQQLGEVDPAQIASCSESLAVLEKEVQEFNRGLQGQQRKRRSSANCGSYSRSGRQLKRNAMSLRNKRPITKNYARKSNATSRRSSVSSTYWRHVKRTRRKQPSGRCKFRATRKRYGAKPKR
jgi:exonuclease SbcC